MRRATTSDLALPHIREIAEVVPCPGGCGTQVEWRYFVLPGGRMPECPGKCDACALPEREEALRKADEARREREERSAAEQVADEAARADQHRERVAQREGEILDVLSRCGVNTREHGHVTLGTFDFAEAGPGVLSECRRFIDEARRAGPHDAVRALYLAGTTGNGKTQLAVAIARELLSDPDWSPADVVFDVAVDLMDEIQDTYNGQGSALEAKLRRIRARVWLLDDLGTERAKEDPARVLYQIVNARALAPTVFTSNHSPDQLEKRNPELARVVSRLGPAYVQAMKVNGKDRRYLKRVPMQPAAD